MYKSVVDRKPELNKPLSGKYKQSFAYPTFLERSPSILDGVCVTMKAEEKEILKQYGEAAVKEVDDIIDRIKALKMEMQTDQPLTDIAQINGVVDPVITGYNDQLKKLRLTHAEEGATWFSLPWLFAECYGYHRLNQIYKSSKSLQKYDPFMPSKVGTLLSSRDAVVRLCENKVDELINLTGDAKKNSFEHYIECSLWGNKADLSLSGGKAVAVEGHDATHKKHILVNNIDKIYEFLIGVPPEERIIDIVLDNAGFELYTDLCFADYLVITGLAKKIQFHGKSIPWFVSDVTCDDFYLILELLKEKIESPSLSQLVGRWTKYIESGVWTLTCESFWVSPYAFNEMIDKDPELYKKLSENALIIFKGDLNYRKLVGDIYWDFTTPFKTALRGFLPTNLVSLRTIKADTIAGLQPGQAESVEKVDSDWLITGKYALIEFVLKD